MPRNLLVSISSHLTRMLPPFLVSVRRYVGNFRISKAVRPTRLPYMPLFSKAEIARLEELSRRATPLSKEEVAVLEEGATYSIDMDSGWLSGFV